MIETVYFWAFRGAVHSRTKRLIWIKTAWLLSIRKAHQRGNRQLRNRYMRQLLTLR